MKLHSTSDLTPSIATSVTAPVELTLEQLQAVAGGGSPKGGWGPAPVAPDTPVAPTDAPVPGSPKGGW